MPAAAVLSALLEFAASAAPDLLAELEKLIASFKQGHPELEADGPPPDGEAKVDAMIDAKVDALPVKSAP